MKIQYFQDTDTLYIEFRPAEVAETRDLDENTLLDADRDGNICGITIEHASQRADIPRFSYSRVTATGQIPCHSRDFFVMGNPFETYNDEVDRGLICPGLFLSR